MTVDEVSMFDSALSRSEEIDIPRPNTSFGTRKSASGRIDTGGHIMTEYQCSRCSYIYEPQDGDPTANIPPGTHFKDLPAAWACPHCGIGQNQFAELKDPESEPSLGGAD